ncbi:MULTISPECIES: helix-turn-helix domain-containing protein [Bacillus]|uniref:helix-turn-helix domain-containing protein n=1 Tax=Bacillus TaxID=1386 RepID=UPI002867F942|nr:helix-turn-helix domain-containing protein [Bacillus cereus]MDA1914985.1 helix-turn-helix domain-containing protein [Bacillus cereus]WMW41407.1 helix-turn-helix domain-containing protein [Bacillus cereus]
MFGLGKKRTKFGRYLDKNGIAQIELERTSKLSTATISKLCNEKKYRPKFSTIIQIVKGMEMLGKKIDKHDFWM